MNIISGSPRRGVMGAAHSQNGQQWYGNQPMADAYANWAVELKPTAFLTLTVKEPKLHKGLGGKNWIVPHQTLLEKANLLIHWVNGALFGRGYQARKAGLIGFGSIERQGNGQPHIHAAIGADMPGHWLAKAQNVVYKKLEKINLFDKRGVLLKPIDPTDRDYYKSGRYTVKEVDRGARALLLDYNGFL